MIILQWQELKKWAVSYQKEHSGLHDLPRQLHQDALLQKGLKGKKTKIEEKRHQVYYLLRHIVISLEYKETMKHLYNKSLN